MSRRTENTLDPTLATYAGSFDPPTFGHTDLIERSAVIYKKVIVAVGNNPRKRYLFSVEERVKLLEDVFVGWANIEVRPFSGLLVDFCTEVGAGVIVRGLRAVTDFEFEFQMGLANMDLEPNIETMFLLTAPEKLFVSSSIVREIADGGRDVSKYVPAGVAKALATKLAQH
ncbi:MAG: pantetheine-phosphate adenylyltransferase [Deltaproteobacteria bacterium CG17_big_fil_post_rev_8_21_14_2_50_63_7]|nr:MAG: pantetheine-phosphate adenylyltransferase [Deltaproteobacteria bacterium CG17_big_fil_post_rev_8_21_14_2_50_63_7]